MSSDPRFEGRLRRLAAVSSVALGLIAVLALTTTDAGPMPLALLFAGWPLMPALLRAGIDRPRWRYLLAAPASMVTAGLLMVTLGFTGPPIALTGWWMITTGVLLGAGLGAWFWFRWLPVPASLDDPFSTGRWSLITVHVALIVVGMALVPIR
jgi:hypothetical protein